MHALWSGMLSACQSLREVERLSERMGRRVPDTTLHDLLGKLSPGQFRRLLVREVLRAQRAKELEPTLPFSVVAIDGKCILRSRHKANRHCQKQSGDGPADRYTMRVLRASLVSSRCKVFLDQRPVAADEAEMSTLPAFLKQLCQAYGRSGLLDTLTLDAGFISLENASLIAEANLGYVMALKNPQKELVMEAERVLGSRTRPDAETPWEQYQGKLIKRLLFRTTQLAGYHGWTHLHEVWRVRQETEHAGIMQVEERYFVTNLNHGRTRGTLPLAIVRAHWGVENNGYWTLDMAWQEDDAPWASAAAEVVSLMRLLAFNVMMRLRTRRLRSEENRTRTWRNLIDIVSDVLLEPARRLTASLAPELVGAAVKS